METVKPNRRGGKVRPTNGHPTVTVHYARDVVAHPNASTPDSVTVIVKLTNGATIRSPPERLLRVHVLTLVRVRLVICVCLHLLGLM